MAEERVAVKVMGIYAHEDKGTVTNHFVLLRDDRGRRVPIFVGQFEAWAISLGLEDNKPERPFTHDAMILCLAAAGATIEEVTINEMHDETFYALVSLRVGDQVHEIDLRPSDAIGLAIRVKCPLSMSEEIIKAAGK